MNVNTVRVVDVWLGQVLCLLLTCVRRCARGLGLEKPPSGPVRKILFIKLIEQGATVLACDALRRAAAMVGRENVYFCVFDENRPILDLVDLVPRENVLVIRNKGLATFAFDTLRVIQQCYALGIDATVDLELFSRAPAALAYLCGAQRRSGCHRFTTEGPYRGDLMTHRVQFSPHVHTSVMYSMLVEALALDATDIPLPKIAPPAMAPEAVPRFQPDGRTVERVETLLDSLGVSPTLGPLVLLNPNASDLMPLRKWPTERFVELAKRLLADDETIRIVVTGAPSEQGPAEAVCSAIDSPRAVCVAGKTTLYELMALYTMANVLVTNDSGPGHFAALTDIDTVVLFGPETPDRYRALGPRCHVVWAGLACSPCVNAFNHRFSPCTNNRCMQAITVDQVAETVHACLRDRQA